MKIERISGRGVVGWKDVDLELPGSGVVLVTGANGAGKSTLIEAVAAACWGKTVRGTPPWQDGAGEVVLRANGIEVARTRKGGRSALTFDGGGADVYDTATKAQEGLDAIVGSFDVWRRTAVFSGADAAHFTLATDGERKRLLEALLRLERFDPALEACRKDLTAARKVLVAAERDAAVAEATVSTHRSALDAMKLAGGEGGEDPAVLEAKARHLGKLAGEAEVALAEAQERFSRAQREAGAGDAEANAAAHAASKLKEGPCHVCGQAITAEMRRAALTRADDAARRAKAGKERAAGALEELRQEVAELRSEHASVDRAAREAEQRWRLAVQAARRAQEAEAAQARALENLARAEEALAEARQRAQEAARDEGELEAVEAALGLRGVRAAVLGRTLAGIEAVANAWLGRIAGDGLRLRLAETGDRRDAISLEVEGAGGGHGYRAASAGERRRIDVSLLLALAEVSAGAAGREPGTVFFDEVFDHLDEDGVERVAAALEELARDRCAVVITHSREVASRLKPALRLRAEAGEVHAA